MNHSPVNGEKWMLATKGKTRCLQGQNRRLKGKKPAHRNSENAENEQTALDCGTKMSCVLGHARLYYRNPSNQQQLGRTNACAAKLPCTDQTF